MERIFSESKEWVRSWSHAFLMAYDKTLTEKLLAVHLKKSDEKQKWKKTRKAIAKLFALNGNAKKNNVCK